MSTLSHPSIVDGWFREINSQWPGQALTLKVNKILHMEQSQYQDVLVFESETYGNVLILDGVVQCTERDEFSYQEMITHLPMASHPNPEHVLVIGGGDGGVVREVLKHKSVKHVTLCDIDEAVVRVSKQYLPHMAELLTDDRVTVFIGDGFKFLPEHENEYDVIITDSSDPVGPAASLFEAPYFTLLKKALKEGGNMSTQGECLWLHLPLIKELRETTNRLFPVAEYAFTTIPTYPSGQIGFVCCSLDANRSVSTPLRPVPDCKYYNNDVHRAAFVLPEFGRAMVQEGKQLLTDYAGVRPGQQGAEDKNAVSAASKKKVLLLGSGFVAQPAAEYITRKGYGLTVAARSVESAQELAHKMANAKGIELDVSDAKALDAAVAEHDLVVSLIPYTFHAAVIESAIRNKKHVVTTSYVSPAMKALEDKCVEAGIIVFNEIGLDPGIDHVAAVDIIDRVHKEGGKVNKFESFCGGLVAAENANNALGYKLSWSARGVLLALRNTAKYLQDGKEVVVDGKDLMSVAKPYYGLPPAYNLQCYPNRDSTPFREFYNIPEAQTVVRGTLRYGDFASVVLTWVEIGLLDDTPKEYLADNGMETTWAAVMGQALGVEAKTQAIVDKLKTLKSFQGDKQQVLIAKYKQLGLVSESKVAYPRGNLLDTLCATLEQDLAMQEGERDLVLLQHKFEVTRADGRVETITSTLEELGAPTGSGRPSAMARLVGVPCGIAVDLVLEGKVGKPGVQAPYDPATCQVFLEAFAKEGIVMSEETF